MKRRIVTVAEMQARRDARAGKSSPAFAKLGDAVGEQIAQQLTLASAPAPEPSPALPPPERPLPSLGAAERSGEALATLARAERGLRLGRQLLELLATEGDTAIGLLALTLATDGVRRAVCARPRDEQRALDDEREQMQLALQRATRRGRG